MCDLLYVCDAYIHLTPEDDEIRRGLGSRVQNSYTSTTASQSKHALSVCVDRNVFSTPSTYSTYT